MKAPTAEEQQPLELPTLPQPETWDIDEESRHAVTEGWLRQRELELRAALREIREMKAQLARKDEIIRTGSFYPPYKDLENQLAEKDAKIAELEAVLNRTIAAVNQLPSATGLSPVQHYSGLHLAISDLQSSYIDAARARNGLHTKMQARAEAAEAKLRAVSEALEQEIIRANHSEAYYSVADRKALLARIRAILEGK